MPAPTIVFDLDGTLVDTAPDLIDTLNVILARHDVAPVAFDEARTMIGAGVKPLLQRALASKGMQFPPDEIDRLFAEYLEVYAAHIADRSRPFPGWSRRSTRSPRRAAASRSAPTSSNGCRCGCSKQLNLSPRFAAICGQDTFTMRKPDPDMLRLTIARAGGDTGHAVMVGDSMTDVATARAAGVPVIAVDFGYTETPPAELGADRLISHFDALPAAVMDLVSIR